MMIKIHFLTRRHSLLLKKLNLKSFKIGSTMSFVLSFQKQGAS
jgi:hypothetical protein